MTQRANLQEWLCNVKFHAVRPRILFTCDYFRPYVGGAEISSFIICRELSKLNWDIYVLTNRLSRTQRCQSYNEIKISRELLFIRGTLNLFQRLLFYLRSAFLVTKYISKIRPAVIITQQLIAIPTILASKLFGIPVIVIVRDYWPVCYYRSLLKPNLEICVTYDDCLPDIVMCARNSMRRHLGMMKSLEAFFALPYALLISGHSLLARFVIKRSNALIAVSNFVKKILTTNGVNPQKIHVIYNPVYMSEVQSVEQPSPSILFVGSLDLKKGIQNIIKAMPKVCARAGETRLIIVGDGPEKDHLRTLIKKLHVENCVQLLGTVFSDHLATLYRSCSLVVVPSIWPEPFGRVVAEALSYNKPVVASNVGGIPELVGQNNGILVSPNDENALVDAIVSLLTGREASKSNLYLGSKFSPQAIAMRYNAIIVSTIRCLHAN